MKDWNNILGNSIKMFLGTCINILISIITTPIITRLVDPENYGEWSLLRTYTNILMAIVMLGLDQALVRFYYKDERIEYKRYLIYNIVKLPVIICLVLIISSAGFVQKLDLFQSNNYIGYILLYINVLISIVNRISQLVIRMEQKGTLYSILMILNKIIYLIVVFLLIFVSDISDFIILTLGTLISQIVITVMGIISCRQIWLPKVHKPYGVDVSLKMLVIYGLPFIYAMLAGDIFNAADKLMIKELKTFYDVGIYASAVNIVAICAVFQTTFNLIWQPLAVKNYEKSPENKSFYIKANGMITVIMFGIGGMIICFKDSIGLILGEEYRRAADIVPFLIFNPIMTTISETTVYGINFKNKTWYHMIITTVAAVINVLLNSYLIPIYSIQGAALSTAISYVLFYFLRTGMSYHCYPIKFPVFRFLIIITLFVGYAFLNTFYQIKFLYNIFLFLLFFIVMVVVYKEYVGYIWFFVCKEFSKRK